MLCMGKGGSDFVLLGMFWVLGTPVLRGDAYHWLVMGIFLGRVLGDATPGCRTVPCLQGVHN